MDMVLVNAGAQVSPETLAVIQQVLKDKGVNIVSIESVRLKVRAERVPEALELIEQIAHMTRDGERLLQNGDIQEDGDACMENDDAIDTVGSLIRQARQMALCPPRVLAEVEEA